MNKIELKTMSSERQKEMEILVNSAIKEIEQVFETEKEEDWNEKKLWRYWN